MLVISVKFHENRTKTVEILRGSKLGTRTSVPRADNPEIKKKMSRTTTRLVDHFCNVS